MKKFEELLHNLAGECRQKFETLSKKESHRNDISDEAEALTKVDQAMTELIINQFEERSESFDFESEEMNKQGISKSKEADYTVIFDEIDGTGNMKNESGPFGPIVGIAEGSNPCFQDMISTIFYDIKNDNLYEAYRGSGAYRDGQKIESKEGLPGQKAAIRGLVDQSMLGRVPEIADILWKYHCKDYGSMGYNMALVASNKADFHVSGGHGYLKDRKTAEEIAPLYLLVTEANGVIIDWEGNEIGRKEIGLSEEKNHDVIVSANGKLASKLAKEINTKVKT